MTQVNKAALLSGSTNKGQLTEVGQIAYPRINDDQILIEAVAYAANPTDWKHVIAQWGGKGDISVLKLVVLLLKLDLRLRDLKLAI